MNENDDLFDEEESKRRRDEGMNNAGKSAHGFNFSHDAGRWFMLLPVGTVFTPDDVIRNVGLPGAGGPNTRNIVGAWINGLARAHFIRWTGRHVKSERIDRHAGENKEWVKIKG
jgi:hypothetical protein